MIRMSAKEYQQMLKQQKPSKHKNKYIYVYADGFASNEKDAPGHGGVKERYDSVKEYQRWKELQLLQRSGRLTGLERQVKLLIKEGFTGADGKKHRPIYYNADFVYDQDGHHIVEDVKGVDKQTGRAQTTEAFRLKWKLLQARYPDWVFTIH